MGLPPSSARSTWLLRQTLSGKPPAYDLSVPERLLFRPTPLACPVAGLPLGRWPNLGWSSFCFQYFGTYASSLHTLAKFNKKAKGLLADTVGRWQYLWTRRELGLDGLWLGTSTYLSVFSHRPIAFASRDPRFQCQRNACWHLLIDANLEPSTVATIHSPGSDRYA